ncbi:hypothetical protein SL267_39030 [Serratia marcescens]|nr:MULTISPECIES: hypothetical protein [Serratia]MDP8716052.1 hypothetical protein [Serratia marcescens]MDP8785254.1 hypothetical protein [Serratia marcescens]OYP00174.1 hypothetical protein CHR63_05965 [Serratia marcescens]UMK51902.1 hypothetical protein L2D49_19845 [Serratia ureilytica]WIJ66526.1 hypothetical protein OI978_11525 [Serratia nevei]
MAICYNRHRYSQLFTSLPDDQGGEGRHKCCGCAYEQGLQQGFKRSSQAWVDLDSLPESQAGTVRHKSPKAAYAKGYNDGMMASYDKPSKAG